MRETMRDNSVRRKPICTASRSKPAARPTQTRKDSSSQVNAPVTRSPTPDDAAVAAQAAQARINEITPRPKAFMNFSHHRYPTPPDEPSTSPANSMRNHLNKTTQQHRPFDYDPEDVQLKDFGGLISRSAESKGRRPHPSGNFHASPKKQMLTQAKKGAVHAFHDYIDMWRDRRDYPSDEHVGIEIMKDYVQQRKQKKQDAKWARAQATAQSPPPHSHEPGTVAWPGGSGVPMSRAMTPPAPPSEAFKAMPFRLQPAFAMSRRRNPSPSVYTTKTDVTTWGKIQRMVDHDNTTPISSTDPKQNFFADAFASKDKGKGRADGMSLRKLNLAVNTTHLPYSQWRPKPTIVAGPSWNPESHVFDPDRDSYPLAAPGNRYRANTMASSIYSQPSALERPRIENYPPPPSIPGEYAHLVTKPHIESRAVSPMTVSTSISAFLPPENSVRNTGRRAGGDWADSYYADKQDDGRVTPLLAEPLKLPPSGNAPGKARGTQFYDFYRDSGFVFNRAK